MSMEDVIKKIVREEFKSGQTFDSHTVIELLRSKKYDNIYYTDELGNNYKITETWRYHSALSQIIRDSGLVDEAGEINSLNVNGNISENHLWKKK